MSTNGPDEGRPFFGLTVRRDAGADTEGQDLKVTPRSLTIHTVPQALTVRWRRSLWALQAALVALAVADAWTTQRALSHPLARAYEANPLSRWEIAHLGIGGMGILRFLSGLGMAWLVEVIARRSAKSGMAVALWSVGLWSAVVLSNLMHGGLR